MKSPMSRFSRILGNYCKLREQKITLRIYCNMYLKFIENLVNKPTQGF